MMKKVLNTEELKVFWDTFEKSYTRHIGYNNIPIYATMCNLSNVYFNPNVKSILELSCGSGMGLDYLVNILKGRDLTIYATDISTNMLDASYEKLKDSKLINLKYKDTFIYNNTKLNVNLFECDNEDIKFSEDGKFDMVISNFSLHLVADPSKMLREVSRVLKDDGVAVFSIWGRPENSPYMTMVPNILKKMNVPLPEVRSNFHISSIEILKPLVLENGFNKFNYSYINCLFNVFKTEDFLPSLNNPGGQKIMESLTQENKDELIKEISNQIDTIINQKNELLAFESLVMMCKKL